MAIGNKINRLMATSFRLPLDSKHTMRHLASEFNYSVARHYICTTCGYFEVYVEDKAKLEAVTKDWTKVG
jgi:hypothetical protein